MSVTLSSMNITSGNIYSPDFTINTKFKIVITGSWSGIVTLQKKFASDYSDVDRFTTNINKKYNGDGIYRFIVKSGHYTSGTIVVNLSLIESNDDDIDYDGIIDDSVVDTSTKLSSLTGAQQLGDASAVWSVPGAAKTNGVQFGVPGAKADGVTDDTAAWQAALDNFPSTGGKLIPFGNSLITQPLIWPNNGTDCVPIIIDGLSASNRSADARADYQTSAITFTGTGNLFDLRGGTDANLQWNGAIKNLSLIGPGAVTATFGIKAYDIKGGQIENVSIHGFGTGLHVVHDLYYAKIKGIACRYNDYGAVFEGLFNGSILEDGTFSNNTHIGLSSTYGGVAITLLGGWIESNGTYGAYFSNPAQVNVFGTYFEGNSSGNLYIASTPFYATSVLLQGVDVEYSTTAYSVILSNVPAFSAYGCSLRAAYNGYAISVPALIGPIGEIVGCRSPRAGGLINPAHAEGLNVADANYAKIINQGGRFARYMANIQKGDLYFNSDADRGVWGCLCTIPGAGSQATALSGITGATTAASPVVTLSAVTGIYAGMHLTIAGETFGGSSYAKVKNVDSATQVTLSVNADTGVTGAAVAYSAAQHVNLRGMELARTVHGTTATSGTGEDNLNSYTVPADELGDPAGLYRNGIEFEAFGTKTGANGNKTIKLKWGSSTICTIPAANDESDWRIRGTIYAANARASQRIEWEYQSGAASDWGYAVGAQDNEVAVTLQVTGECAHASDVITQTIWLVRSK